MKLGQLVDNPLFLKALKDLSSQPLPVLAAYKLVTIMEIRDREVGRWQKVRNALLQSYGKKDEKGELVISEDGTQYVLEKTTAFNEDYNHLISLPVDIPKLSIEELKDVKLSAESLLILRPILALETSD